MKCSACGFENEKDAFFCGNCGTNIRPKREPKAGMKECPNCKTWNKEEYKFCIDCGFDFRINPENYKVFSKPSGK